MPDKNNTIKAAVYCRYATEAQLLQSQHRKTALYCRTAVHNDFAIQEQEERLRGFAEQNGYDVITCYADNGESGASLDRPAMNRLITDIQSNEVQTVIVATVDRIARSATELLHWISIMEKTGVKCLVLNQADMDSSTEFRIWRDFIKRL